MSDDVDIKGVRGAAEAAAKDLGNIFEAIKLYSQKHGKHKAPKKKRKKKK